MKKILAILVAAAMLFVLSGCGNDFTPNKLTINQPSSYDMEEVEITDSDKIAELWDYYVNLEYTGTTNELSESGGVYVTFENTQTQEYESFIVFSSGLFWFDENADEEETEYYYAAKGSETYNTFYELFAEGNAAE